MTPLVLTACLGLSLLIGSVMAATVGVVHVPFGDALRVVGARIVALSVDVPPLYQDIVWNVRMPRVAVAAMVGAALAVSGAAMQGLFKNPLVSPGLAGVSAGAAFGAAMAIFLQWHALHPWLLPLSAFAGALAAAAVVYGLATEGGRTEMTALLLAGMAVSSFFTAMMSLLYHFVEDGLLRQIVYWLMGNLTGRRWDHVMMVAPFTLAGGAGLWYFASDLNLLMGGEDEARSMGVPVESTRRWILALVALTTGAAVSVSGIIGFVGLMVPHMVRLVIGPDHRWLLPASALAGAVFLIAADLVARTVFEPVEVRTGIVTALFGVPFFLHLLTRRRHWTGWA